MHSIGGLHFDPETTQAIERLLLERVGELIAEEGLCAFEIPRTAAVAHEAGHAIVGRYCFEARSCEFFRCAVPYGILRRAGCSVWGGLTKWSQPHPFGTTSGPIDFATIATPNILAQISIVIAGAVAEVVLDPAGCRAGFSIDEIIVGQLFCNQLGARLGIPGEKRWGICWWRTASVLEHNERTARALMKKLDAAGIVRRKKLTGLTADVRKILPDPFDVINEGWRPNI